MKKERNFSCRVHHRIFFSEQAAQEHIKEKCHPENIIRLKGENLLERMTYNIISEAIDTSSLTEKGKEKHKQVYL